jgi:hypothetical protein
MLEYNASRYPAPPLPMYMEGCESRGSVFKPARAGLIIKLARIEGKIIKTIKKAQAHGLELAIEWVDSKVLLSSKNPAS